MEYEASYKNLVLVGTSHIAKKSVERINHTFEKFQPDIICIELDNKRLHALLTDAKPDYSLRGIRKYGFQGYMFAVIASTIQNKLGNVIGTKPGSDMLTAARLAMENKKQLELIDQDIDITLKKFSKRFTFREKLRLVWDIIRAPFSKKQSFNLNDVPEHQLISRLMSEMKRSYPNLYFVLVEERNQIMARRIYHIISSSPEKRVMAVIGAGHEAEMLRLIKQEYYKRDRIYG